jgi:hypothetical protein
VDHLKPANEGHLKTGTPKSTERVLAAAAPSRAQNRQNNFGEVFPERNVRRKFRGTCSVCSVSWKGSAEGKVAIREKATAAEENGFAPTKRRENVLLPG